MGSRFFVKLPGFETANWYYGQAQYGNDLESGFLREGIRSRCLLFLPIVRSSR
jgi:hypothetical protein